MCLFVYFRKRKGENNRNIDERKSFCCLLHTTLLGVEPPSPSMCPA